MEWFLSIFLLTASAEDILERRVRNPLMLILLAVVLAETAYMLIVMRYIALIDRAAASALVFCSFLTVGLRNGGVGGADIKAASLLALHAGLIRTVLFIPLSFLLMALCSAVGKLSGHTLKSAPYIPFLSAAYILMLQLI
jgi:Flp pilus assembly protein protease CpaA